MAPIGIVGNGNVAYHLLNAFSDTINPVDSLFARAVKNGQSLIDVPKLKPTSIKGISEVQNFEGTLFLCINDDQIESFLRKYPIHKETVLIHTSGPMSMEILKASKVSSYGVIYPFQSMTKNKPLIFSEVPLLIEWSDKKSFQHIESIANTLSHKVIPIDSEKRLRLHLASVLINNFTNNLYEIAETLIEDTGLVLSDFEHLMDETKRKALQLGPIKAQTGPAKRNDQLVMQKHLELFNQNEELKQLYRLHSSLIQKKK